MIAILAIYSFLLEQYSYLIIIYGNNNNLTKDINNVISESTSAYRL
jgi:hypothetical protein